MMISIGPGIAFDSDEVSETFVRASGPGGQNVNKVSSAVQVRLDLRASPSIPEAVRVRAERLAGSRMTRDGVLVITAQQYRSQERNRQDALDRIVTLLRAAAHRPTIRIGTKPSYGAKKRRVEAKVKRGAIKRLRGGPDPD